MNLSGRVNGGFTPCPHQGLSYTYSMEKRPKKTTENRNGDKKTLSRLIPHAWDYSGPGPLSGPRRGPGVVGS